MKLLLLMVASAFMLASCGSAGKQTAEEQFGYANAVETLSHAGIRLFTAESGAEVMVLMSDDTCLLFIPPTLQSAPYLLSGRKNADSHSWSLFEPAALQHTHSAPFAYLKFRKDSTIILQTAGQESVYKPAEAKHAVFIYSALRSLLGNWAGKKDSMPGAAAFVAFSMRPANDSISARALYYPWLRAPAPMMDYAYDWRARARAKDTSASEFAVAAILPVSAMSKYEGMYARAENRKGVIHRAWLRDTATGNIVAAKDILTPAGYSSLAQMAGGTLNDSLLLISGNKLYLLNERSGRAEKIISLPSLAPFLKYPLPSRQGNRQ